MTTPEQMLSQARRWIGYREDPPGSNKTIFGTWYGWDGVPWCAEAVSYWFFQAGLPLPASTPKGFASTVLGARWFFNAGRAGSTARVGAVAFFHFPGGPSKGRWKGIHHVGVVEAVSGPNNTITTIEGNTSVGDDRSGGRVMRRHRNPAYVVLYGYPDYALAPPVEPERTPPTPTTGGLVAELTAAEETSIAKAVKRGVSAAMTLPGQPNSSESLAVFEERLTQLRDGQNAVASELHTLNETLARLVRQVPDIPL